MVRRATLHYAFIIITCVVVPDLAVPQSSDRTAVVRGIVYDSLIGSAPLEGAEIWIEGTNRTARTDAAGRFEIAALPAGRWRLNFSHPLLDSLGLSAPGALVDATAGSAAVVLATPGPAAAHRMLCPHDPFGATGAILTLVRDAVVGTALGDVFVTAEWTVYVVGRGGIRGEPRAASARSDAAGRLLLCNVPTDVTVVLRGRSGGGPSGMALVDLAGRPFRRAYLLLASSAATGAVTGVVRSWDGSPVPGATVIAVGTDRRALADEFGEFSLQDVAAGSQVLEARAVGYPQGRTPATIQPGVTQRVALKLGDSVQVLEPVTVETRYQPYLKRVGFDVRRRTAMGHFLDTTDIRRSGAVQFEEVFRMVPGVQLRPNGSGYVVELQRGEGQITNPALANYCPPSYFIDGVYAPQAPIQTPSLPVVPAEVLAVEIYSSLSSAPPQYQRMDSGCGVILIWTKRGVPKQAH